MSSQSRFAARLGTAILVIAGALTAVYYQTRPVRAAGPEKAEKAEKGAKGEKGEKGGSAASARAVPVLVSEVQQRDVPVWLEGLGTAQAWQQVTIRAQVEGQLERVYFKEGETVKKGQLLAQVDPRPFQVQLQQAKGALARDQATLEAGERNLVRYQLLDQKKLVARQQLDDQVGQVGQTRGTLAVDQAAIRSAKLNLSFARIRSPLAGVTGVRLVDAGNLVRPTDPTGIVVVAQLDPAAVFLTLPQDELPLLTAAQQRGEVVVEAWSRDGRTLLGTGTLEVIDNQINLATSTLKLKSRVPNPKARLWPNQFVKARVLVDVQKNALVIPAAAVQRGPQGAFVYVVEKDSTAALRTVEVGFTTAENVVIKKGLAAGEKVVAEGQNQLRPGTRVSTRLAPAPAPPPGTTARGTQTTTSKATKPAGRGDAKGSGSAAAKTAPATRPSRAAPASAAPGASRSEPARAEPARSEPARPAASAPAALPGPAREAPRK